MQKVLHRETRKYITIPDVFGLKIRDSDRKDIICYYVPGSSYRLQYINQWGKPFIQRVSTKAVHEYFRNGYYSIRKVGAIR